MTRTGETVVRACILGWPRPARARTLCVSAIVLEMLVVWALAAHRGGRDMTA